MPEDIGSKSLKISVNPKVLSALHAGSTAARAITMPPHADAQLSPASRRLHCGEILWQPALVAVSMT